MPSVTDAESAGIRQRLDRREKMMTANKDSDGICEDCKHRLLCRNRQARPHPIWHCDEFEPAQSLHVSSTTAPIGLTPSVVPVEFYEEELVCEAEGLCRTCVHRDTCTFRTPVGGVWHCEEFEFAADPIDKTTNTFGPRRHASGPINRPYLANGPEPVLGLCRTCAKRDTCTFPKGGGGVWHCEEYE
jgi:hypothetical protein